MSPATSILRPLRGLRVDLSTGSSVEDELPVEVARDYLGGRGLGAYLALRERLYDVEPLAPENLLIFAPGPLTGTGAPAAGRYSVTSRSPLTGTVFDGNSGGSWGVALRKLGLDYLIVGGACGAPSYLFVDAGSPGAEAPGAGPSVALRPAGDLWGLDVPAALARVRELHPGCEAGVIGPAGERGVLFASSSTTAGAPWAAAGWAPSWAPSGSRRSSSTVTASAGLQWPIPTASRSSSTRRRSSSRRTRSPRRRCPSSARPCWSTC